MQESYEKGRKTPTFIATEANLAFARGDIEAADELFRSAIKEAEFLHGKESVVVAIILEMEAIFFEKCDRRSEAAEALSRAQRILRLNTESRRSRSE